MAALDTPWIADTMPATPSSFDDGAGKTKSEDPNPPTFAAFSPSASLSPTKQRSTVLVHRKSPLLVATPPAVTRALAFSHPFILPLNYLVGLLTWSTGDAWESFLLVAAFWATVLYGDQAVRYAGPMVLVVAVILGMYFRRYSPLSSTTWTGEKNTSQPEGNAKHQKSLDEILETLNTFTSRCNALLEPLLQLTDFLSTQNTATSATTRPALTSLFIRILFISPLWIVCTFPPFYLLTTKRAVLAGGTIILSWHSRPARVSRAVLWRSRSVRRVLAHVTGLQLSPAGPHISQNEEQNPPPLPPRGKAQHDAANSVASKIEGASTTGVRFTFVVFENQRRWLGLGWTSTMLAYERSAWTDEHLSTSASKDDFELPIVENGTAKWQWVPGSQWQAEGGAVSKGKDKGKQASGADGWIYYDNKWDDGRRGQDGWGRYTRRRKWYRDAELVEVKSNTQSSADGGGHDTPPPRYSADHSNFNPLPSTSGPHTDDPNRPGSSDADTVSVSSSQAKRRGFLRRVRGGSGGSDRDRSAMMGGGNDDEDARTHVPPEQQPRENEWEIGDDVKMSLG